MQGLSAPVVETGCGRSPPPCTLHMLRVAFVGCDCHARLFLVLSLCGSSHTGCSSTAMAGPVAGCGRTGLGQWVQGLGSRGPGGLREREHVASQAGAWGWGHSLVLPQPGGLPYLQCSCCDLAPWTVLGGSQLGGFSSCCSHQEESKGQAHQDNNVHGSSVLGVGRELHPHTEMKPFYYPPPQRTPLENTEGRSQVGRPGLEHHKVCCPAPRASGEQEAQVSPSRSRLSPDREELPSSKRDCPAHTCAGGLGAKSLPGRWGQTSHVAPDGTEGERLHSEWLPLMTPWKPGSTSSPHDPRKGGDRPRPQDGIKPGQRPSHPPS